MKNRAVLLMIAALVVVAGAIFLLRRPEPAPPAAPPTPTTPSPLPPEVVPAPAVGPVTPQGEEPAAPTKETPVAPKTDQLTVEGETEPVPVVRVLPNQILATVNYIPITLKDLMPVAPNVTEQALTPEEYDARLDRAIDMSVTFQAARNRGVTLTTEQQEQIGRIRQEHLERFEQHKRELGITWSSVTDQQLEFEERVRAALLLQQNLVTREYGTITSQPDYERAVQELMAELRAQANITIPSPTP